MFTKYHKLFTFAAVAMLVTVAYAVAPTATAAMLPGIFDHQSLLLLGAAPAFMLLGETMNDVFNQDAFGFVALTDAINKMPFAPSRASTVVDWNEQGVPLDTVEFEQISNVLTLVNPTPRGGPGETRAKPKRDVEVIKIPHYELNGAVNASEVQGVRMFGSASQMQTVQAKVAEVQTVQASDLDATLEYQRIGALSGIVLNGDGSTYVNLFTKFAVTPQTEVDFNLDSTADDGALLTVCTQVVRGMSRALGGAPFSGVYAFCSDTFWDALLANTERRKTYQAQNAAQLRDGSAWGTFSFGGITFENYRGGVGTEEGTAFIPTNKAWLFPLGVPRLFRTVYAPADYWETVNTIGLPRYTRLLPWENQKGASIDSQMNAMSYCTRPRALFKGELT